jgi:hypothetical protein
MDLCRRKGVIRLSWVGVWYRKIALPEIMQTTRLWLDQRRFQPRIFEYVISGAGTLVRAEFTQDAEAAEFAEAFGGVVSRDRPSIEGTEQNTAERSEAHGS